MYEDRISGVMRYYNWIKFW